MRWDSEEGWSIGFIIALLVVAFAAFSIYRDIVRRRSLRKREDGRYVWSDWNGKERTSDKDPSKPGGEWESDGGGADGGDGGGGD